MVFNKAIDNPDLPEWFTRAHTFLIPKNGETDKPKNYRPIACLPTLYKILTSIISESSYKRILTNNILPEEQKCSARNSYGCKDQLLVNKAMIEDCKKKRKNVNIQLNIFDCIFLNLLALFFDILFFIFSHHSLYFGVLLSVPCFIYCISYAFCFEFLSFLDFTYSFFRYAFVNFGPFLLMDSSAPFRNMFCPSFHSSFGVFSSSHCKRVSKLFETFML